MNHSLLTGSDHYRASKKACHERASSENQLVCSSKHMDVLYQVQILSEVSVSVSVQTSLKSAKSEGLPRYATIR